MLDLREDFKRLWRIKLGIVSDTHLCSVHQQLTHLTNFYERCKAEGIKHIFHAGDVGAGKGVYQGQDAELFVHTGKGQLEYMAQTYPAGIRTHILAGNHDWSFVKRGGIDILEPLCEQHSSLNYLSPFEAWARLTDHVTMYIYHPDRGFSKKKIENKIKGFNPKPTILVAGHWHFYDHYIEQGVHVILPGCFEGNTIYTSRNSLHPAIGGVIVTIDVDENGHLCGGVGTHFVGPLEEIKHDY